MEGTDPVDAPSDDTRTSEATAGRTRPRTNPKARGRTRRRRRKVRIPAWSVPLVVVATLLVAEFGARVVGPNIPRTSGSEERAYVKADQLYRRTGPTTVVVLGSSETAGGIVPSIVEAKAPRVRGVYNAALAGTFLPTYREWAERVVVPAVHPKVVVISLLPMTVADIDATRAANYEKAKRAYTSAFDQITGGRLGAVGWKLRQRSALIRYRPYLRQPALLAKGVAETVSGGDGADTEGGVDKPTGMDWTTEDDPAVVEANTGPDGEVYDYHQQSAPVSSDPLGAGIYNAFAKGRLDLDGIDEFVRWLRSKGIVPVILVPPVDRGPLTKGGANLAVLDGWSRSLVAWAKAHDVPIRNEFTEEWPSDLFHDRNHVDEAGAERLSAELGTWLDELCRRGELDDACTATG